MELKEVNLYGIKEFILKEHERMNINIPINKENFLNYFKEIIKEKEKFKYRLNKMKRKFDFPKVVQEQENKNM